MLEIVIGAVCAVLLAVLIVQIGKARELASAVRSDKKEEEEVNRMQGALGMVFMIIFLIACVWSFIKYTPTSLGWGPNTASSTHGTDIDYMFNLTLFFTAIVFFVTQYLLFYYAWKYRGRKGNKAIYWSHNAKLEMVWMIIPAVVMTFLVVGGLNSWNMIMADVGEDEKIGEDYMEIQALGHQFAWQFRYPGRDAVLGETDFTKVVPGFNEMGQVWTDVRNVDDFNPGSTIYLPVDKKIRVRITARDVLHNFYIRDMRVKMDAIPGMPTYFVFTPTVTTDSIRSRYKKYPEWQTLVDGVPRYATYDYELSCAELCGKSHYSMRNLIKIYTQEKYEEWLDEQEGSFSVTVDRDPVTNMLSINEEALAEVQRNKLEQAVGSVFYNEVIAKNNKVIANGTPDQLIEIDDAIQERYNNFLELILEKSKVNAIWTEFEKKELAAVKRQAQLDLSAFETEVSKGIKPLLSIARTTNDLEKARVNTATVLKYVNELIPRASQLLESLNGDEKEKNEVITSPSDTLTALPDTQI